MTDALWMSLAEMAIFSMALAVAPRMLLRQLLEAPTWAWWAFYGTLFLMANNVMEAATGVSLDFLRAERSTEEAMMNVFYTAIELLCLWQAYMVAQIVIGSDPAYVSQVVTPPKVDRVVTRSMTNGELERFRTYSVSAGVLPDNLVPISGTFAFGTMPTQPVDAPVMVGDFLMTTYVGPMEDRLALAVEIEAALHNWSISFHPDSKRITSKGYVAVTCFQWINNTHVVLPCWPMEDGGTASLVVFRSTPH